LLCFDGGGIIDFYGYLTLVGVNSYFC